MGLILLPWQAIVLRYVQVPLRRSLARDLCLNKQYEKVLKAREGFGKFIEK
jgi:hypothetical protein